MIGKIMFEATTTKVIMENLIMAEPAKNLK